MQDQSTPGSTCGRTHPTWQDASLQEPQWTVLMQIIKDKLNETDCAMIETANVAGNRKQKRRLDSHMCNKGV